MENIHDLHDYRSLNFNGFFVYCRLLKAFNYKTKYQNIHGLILTTYIIVQYIPLTKNCQKSMECELNIL